MSSDPHRPALPVLKRSDRVIIRESYGMNRIVDREAIVTGVGPKWVRVVPSGYFGSDYEKSYERRFLLADQQEGAPGKRVGYGTYFVTPEQYEYDRTREDSVRIVRDIGGLDIRRDSPFYDTALLRKLALAVIRLVPVPPSTDG